MQVEFGERFKKNLQTILERIAKDKLSASRNFRKELLEQIKTLPHFPYKYRQSFYFDDGNVRDMIFRGYTIVYEINTDNNVITVLDIFNKNKR